MEVTGYEFYPAPAKDHILKLETDTGITGWGAPVVEGRPRVVEEMAAYLLDSFIVGESPLAIEHHWQSMYRSARYRGGPDHMSAVAGIDQALWDIKGKHYNAPVYDLLGGAARDCIQAYQWVHGDSPDELSDDARQKVDSGYRAIKLNAPERMHRIDSPAKIQRAADRVGAVREEVGQSIQIAVDFHGRVSKSAAPQLADALAEYDPMFIEEPLVPEQTDEMERLAHRTNTPIATGERLYSRWDFRPLLEMDAVDIVQPDVSHAGGITETKKIADLAETYDTSIAPHCPLGPLSLAASLHVDIATPNALVQEASAVRRETPEYVANPEFLQLSDDGMLAPPSKPGLGVEIDEDVLEEYDQEIGYERQRFRHSDGSVAEN